MLHNKCSKIRKKRIKGKEGLRLLTLNFFLKSTDNGQQTTDFGYAVTELVEVTNYAFDKLRHQNSALLCVSARERERCSLIII